MSRKKEVISIVATLYKSKDYIEEFYNRAKNAVKATGLDYEIIFVNDGSPDDSLEIALKLHKKDSNVKVINLSKNYGQHLAILCGLSKSSGDYVVTIDVDLEEKPELIEDLYNKIKKTKSDIVYGVRKDSNTGLLYKICRKIFWSFYRIISDYSVRSNVSNLRIMNRKFCDALAAHREKGWILSAMTNMCGYKQETLIVNREYKGSTTYGLLKRIRFMVKHVINYSSKPLYTVSYIGFFITLISFVFGISIIARKLLFGIVVSGWSSIMASIWFIGGMIIFFLGLMGIYIANIFIDVKQRPIYLIQDEYGFKKADKQ